MCGIAGMIRLQNDNNTIHKMLDTMKRRGPDEQGVYKTDDVCLLHQRLTIIDPENGKQPISLKWMNQTFTMVYNGELYNTEELRQELIKCGHTFSGHSDTEVLLHCYAQWGAGCLKRLNGIYGFAVWEHQAARLFIARDRMGVKPLFYGLHKDGFIFASEIKTILAHPDFPAKIDQDGICQLLLLGPGRIPGSGVFQNIVELRPGCCGYFADGHFVWQQYWKLKDREHTESFAQTADHIRYLVTDTITRQMVSDVPVGTFLSGGLDSSLISSVCNKVCEKNGLCLPTFSVGYKDNEKYFIPGKFQPNSDESYIKIMCDYLKSNHHYVSIGPDELYIGLQDAVRARDLPGMADVDSSLLVFCHQIRKDVKVALSGECADEIFGGYPWFRDPEIRASAGFPWSQNVDQRLSLLKKGLINRESACDFVQDQYLDTLARCDILPETSAEERRIKELVNLNINWFMQTLLDRKDRMSMYCSLEVRVPFCDHRIAEYMYGVPWEYKEYQGREKGLLRYAMRDFLPYDVLYRKKSPYPKTFDPKYMILVSEQLKGIISDSQQPIHQIVDKVALEELLTADHTWPWYGQLMRTPQTIAFMLQLNQWLCEYNVEIMI